MLLNYHIGRFVLVSLCVADLVRFGLNSIRVVGRSLQHGRYSKLTTPNLQHTAKQKQNDQCGNSTTHSQVPEDGYINVRKMVII
jgi:hypothetical protein